MIEFCLKFIIYLFVLWNFCKFQSIQKTRIVETKLRISFFLFSNYHIVIPLRNLNQFRKMYLFINISVKVFNVEKSTFRNSLSRGCKPPYSHVSYFGRLGKSISGFTILLIRRNSIINYGRHHISNVILMSLWLKCFRIYSSMVLDMIWRWVFLVGMILFLQLFLVMIKV